MGGHCYGEEQPTEKCPYCGAVCDADFVDVGVGFTQCGPYHCEQCGASEIGSFDDETRQLSDQEKSTGWYGPDHPPSDKANVIAGKIVSHRQMKETYKDHFKGNSLWEDKDYVAEWWEEIRK
jgi:hypothetical protein